MIIVEALATMHLCLVRRVAAVERAFPWMPGWWL